MKVERVNATIRYSQDTGKGAWKVIEIGAEGSVDDRENWQSSQAYLYAELGKQLKSLWTNGNGATTEVNGGGGAESHGEAVPESGPGPTSREGSEHWCAEHRMAYTQKNGKAGESWWSHKAPDGSWCRE